MTQHRLVVTKAVVIAALMTGLGLPGCTYQQPNQQEKIFDSPGTATLASACTGCHGTQREQGQLIPVLAGRRATSLEQQMLGYRDNKRSGTLMPRLLKAYSDQQISELAKYFSTLTQDQ